MRINHSKAKLLLHLCCACCATEVYNRLKDDFWLTLFWYNPNIYPYSEYKKRLNSFRKLTDNLNCRFILGSEDRDYKSGNEKWQKAIKGVENEPEGRRRCAKCFKFRLSQTAKVAKDNGYDIFATTLTISPHKSAPLINRIGQDIANEYNIDFLPSDFKKQEGFKRSIELSKHHKLYRQQYCGCIYSKDKQ